MLCGAWRGSDGVGACVSACVAGGWLVDPGGAAPGRLPGPREEERRFVGRLGLCWRLGWFGSGRDPDGDDCGGDLEGHGGAGCGLRRRHGGAPGRAPEQDGLRRSVI